MDADLARRIQQHVLRFAATRSRDFPSLRSSGEVDLDLLQLGARHHRNPKVRWQCLTLLDHLDGDTSVPVFIDALCDPVPRVRRHALHALTCDRCKETSLSVDVVPYLVQSATTDENRKVRDQALTALRKYLPDPRAAEVLTPSSDVPVL